MLSKHFDSRGLLYGLAIAFKSVTLAEILMLFILGQFVKVLLPKPVTPSSITTSLINSFHPLDIHGVI